MKIYAVFLLILLIILQYKFWFEEGGYIYNIRLEKELAEMKTENKQLKERNLELAHKIILVKEDLNEIEALARQNLGMIKEGERYMFIIDKNKDQKRSSEPAPKQQDKPVKEEGNAGTIIRK